MNFDIKTEQLVDDAYVISLSGEVDLYTAPEFKQQLLDVIGKGAKSVIVDFSNTTFIDSTTLGVLVGGVKRLRTNDGQLVARLQRPQHHEDLRDHRPRPRLHDLRDARRGGRRAELVGAHAELVRRGGALLALATALLAAGCGTGGISKGGDSDKGKTALPRQVRAAATRSPTRARTATRGRTSTTPSPTSRKQGFKQETIEQVVRDQIELAVPPMPQNLVTGADADAVAAYVARSPASRSPAKNTTSGKDIFTANCGSCHTLDGRRARTGRSARTSTS